MPKLILLRHGQSQWNLENRFTGWEDVDLSPLGEQEARSAGFKLRDIPIDSVYTSALKRAIRTATLALDAAGRKEMSMTMHEALNERHYGDLQGLNKAEMAEKYGPEQVHIWRRSFDVRPPGEKGESLAMTIQRVLPYFEEHIVRDLHDGKSVLIVAHGNSLRSLLYHLDKHTEETIMQVNIPTGVPIVYDMEVRDGALHVLSRTEMTDVPTKEEIPQKG
jgi:2,3-bisphosphoglycerate-dependent phosphoglycerate mutase